ncbi:MAG: hypothetical protein Q9195_002630 [Heterodermia aff. obscurata]
MAFPQSRDPRFESRQPNVHPQSNTRPQLYNQSTRGYTERSFNPQRPNYQEFDPVQQPQKNGYANSMGRGYSVEGSHQEDSGRSDNKAYRTPPGRFHVGDYERLTNRLPMQPSQPRPIDTRQGTSRDMPTPRSAGPHQTSNEYNIQNELHASHDYPVGTGQYDGSTNATYEGYGEALGHHGYDHYDDKHNPNYDGRTEQSYRPSHSQKIHQHYRGHSDGFYQSNETASQNLRQEFGQKRPNYQQSKGHPNGGSGVQKRRVFENPTSPATMSWDNPFPTFPAKRKGVEPDHPLEGSMASMSLTENAGDMRPETVSSRGSNDAPRSVSRMQPLRGELPPIRGAHYPRYGPFVSVSRQQQEVYNDRLTEDVEQRPRHPNAAQNGTSTGRPIELRPEGVQYDQFSFRSDPTVNRASDEHRESAPRQYRVLEPDMGRSKTMPSAVSNAIMYPQTQVGDRQSPASQEPERIAPGRPSTASGSRPAGPGKTRSGEILQLRSEQARPSMGNGRPDIQQVVRPPAIHQDSIADLYDSYYDPSSPEQSNHTYQLWNNHQRSIEKNMPDFDALASAQTGHQRGMTIEDHITPRRQSPKVPPLPGQHQQRDPTMSKPGTYPRQMMHSKSQPDLSNHQPPDTQQDYGFDFGIPEASSESQLDHTTKYEYREGPTESNHRQPPAPYRSNGDPRLNSPYSQPTGGARSFNSSSQQLPKQPLPQRYRADFEGRSNDSYGREVPNSQAQIDRYRSPIGQDRAPSNGPSPAAGRGPNSPPPMKPDALPVHPSPVRPGLMQSSSQNQPPKPPPVRNYNNGASPLQDPSQMQLPATSDQPVAPSVAQKLTSSDLEKLRFLAKSNPTDQKAHLTLAKGLAQAASALEEYIPQPDQKARNKTRERYIAEAYKIVKRLVSTAYPDAMFFLGDCYSQGRLGLDRDTKEAFSLYQGAAKAGHAQAAFRVAVCCELGLEEDGGTKRDLGKAVQWYKRAATLGDTPAMYKTGVIQLKGLLGQPKDAGEAVVWLRKAAEKADKDNPHALHELALWHEAASGSGRIAGDEENAKQLFVQAAELGYKFSQYRLGRACEYGLMGCPIDPRVSISWYSKAAVQEEHQSELALSGWYLTGADGVLQQSDTEAYLWARKAATAGLAKAEFAMGYFTEVGIGCPPSSEEAKRWYWRAACKVPVPFPVASY